MAFFIFLSEKGGGVVIEGSRRARENSVGVQLTSLAPCHTPTPVGIRDEEKWERASVKIK